MPGPNGLPGGYPVVAGPAGVEVRPPLGLDLAAAIKINEDSHRFDGIDRIEPDGTVIFTSQNADILRDQLGYECYSLAPSEIHPRAEELMRKVEEFRVRAPEGQ